MRIFTVCGDFPNVSDVKFSTGREMTDITFTASRTEEQPEKLFGIITVLDSDGKFKYTMAKEFIIDTSQGEIYGKCSGTACGHNKIFRDGQSDGRKHYRAYCFR